MPTTINLVNNFNPTKSALRESVFLLTIVPNKRTYDNASINQMATALAKVSDFIQDHVASFINLPEGEDHTVINRIVETDGVVEYNSKGNVHTHVMLWLEHSSDDLKVDLTRVRSLVKKVFPDCNPHVNVKVTGSATLRMRDYIHKYDKR